MFRTRRSVSWLNIAGAFLGPKPWFTLKRRQRHLPLYISLFLLIIMLLARSVNKLIAFSDSGVFFNFFYSCLVSFVIVISAALNMRHDPAQSMLTCLTLVRNHALSWRQNCTNSNSPMLTLQFVMKIMHFLRYVQLMFRW